MLKDIPSFAMQKQSQIILACIALHNFVKENDEQDKDFQRIDQDENYVVLEEPSSSQANGAGTSEANKDGRMNMSRDWIVDGLYNRS
jgi:hypothetical protein